MVYEALDAPMLVTYYKVDARARRYLHQHNAFRENEWVPVVVPCRGRVICDSLPETVRAWFEARGYPRFTEEEDESEDVMGGLED